MKKRRYFIVLLLVALAAALGFIVGKSAQKKTTVEPNSRKPLIGIASGTDSTYVRAIHEAGGIPLILPTANSSPIRIAEYLQLLDGLLMPGGADIPPSEYGEEPHPTTSVINNDRYHFEKALIHSWINTTEKPLLGICLGCQWINVAHGGSLIQDIPSEFAVSHRNTSHLVTLEKDSQLSQIFGDSQFEVNSHHHQAVRDIGEGLRIVAKSPDGIIEATETTDPTRFLIGVQWHPERMSSTDPRQKKLFAAFIKASQAQ